MRRFVCALALALAAGFAGAGTVREPLRVTLTFDDGLKDHLLIVAPELESRGWRGTFNLITDAIGSKPQKLTWEDARDLVRRGHELACHTKTHPHMVRLLEQKGETAVRAELALAREAIVGKTGFTPRLYCPPFCQQNEKTARLASLEGMEQFSIPRRNFGAGCGTSVRAYLLGLYENGTKRADILHHGVCSVGNGGNGGWCSIESRAAFAAHLDAIAELEREGKVIVSDYHGAVSDCRLKEKAWPRHGAVALGFDGHRLATWERTFPIFALWCAHDVFRLRRCGKRAFTATSCFPAQGQERYLAVRGADFPNPVERVRRFIDVCRLMM